MSTRLRWSAQALVLLAAVPTATGCGHPATREECRDIFDKSAELELREQNVTDPEVIAQRLAAVRSARGDELVDQCVGRRVTDRALGCVRNAESGAQVDRCLE